MNAALTAKNIQVTIRNLLAKREVVTATINGVGNESLRCLFTGTCGSGLSGTLRIFNPDGSLFYDAQNLQAGFDINGLPCSSYQASSIYSNCPIRADVQWTIQSQSLTVTVSFLSNYFYLKNIRRRLSNLNFVQSISLNLDDPVLALRNQSCNSVNGVFDVPTGKCTPNFFGRSCPSNQYLVGINSDGTLNCNSF